MARPTTPSGDDSSSDALSPPPDTPVTSRTQGKPSLQEQQQQLPIPSPTTKRGRQRRLSSSSSLSQAHSDDSNDSDSPDAEARPDTGSSPKQPRSSPPLASQAQASTSSVYVYPAAVPDVTTYSEHVQDFKLARFLPCRTHKCDCPGLRPPLGANVQVQETNDTMAPSPSAQTRSAKGKVKEAAGPSLNKLNLWDTCGSCGHGWRLDDEPDGGHTLSEEVGEIEQQRRRRVAGRMEELYSVSSLECGVIYSALTPKSILSGRTQVARL